MKYYMIINLYFLLILDGKAFSPNFIAHQSLQPQISPRFGAQHVSIYIFILNSVAVLK